VLHSCLGREDETDLRRALRGGGPDALEAAIRSAIDAKPEGHDFKIERGAAPALARHMSRTGG
jgi:cyclic pyranopterin phosphate synthase